MKRSLQYLTWTDPLAWTESMQGSKWNSLIKNEEKQYTAVLAKVTTPSETQRIVDELIVGGQAQKSEPFEVGPRVQIWDTGTYAKSWKWTTTAEEHSCADCVADLDGNVWDVEDTGSGAEIYTVRFWPYLADSSSWSIEGVGPYVVVLDNTCFYLEAQNSLWFSRFCAVNAISGKRKQLLYEEKNPLWNLSLKRGENNTAYLVREDSGLQEAFFFTSAMNLESLGISGFFVVGGGATNEYFATKGRGTDEWKAYGKRLSRWILPEHSGIPEAVYVEKQLLLMRKQGERYLWKCSSTSQPILIFKGVAHIQFNEHGIFLKKVEDSNKINKSLTLRITEPGSFTRLCTLEHTRLVCKEPLSSQYASYTREFTDSVPYILVFRKKVPLKNLLITGYGAYGHPSSLDTVRWLPLLNRGWAIVIAMVRGGGDDTMAYADAARTWKRENSIADFETVIQSAQKKLGISAKHTVVYGRSAGGILIGAAAARQTKTSLFAGLYGEVPYLDVLRTTTNPMLPLTRMEYNEFGNPSERLEDLITLGKISPMEGIPQQGYPGLFALMRTGANDKEVFAYEPLKWILKARGKNKNDTTKILALSQNQGHFVHGTTGLLNRANDLALLLAWSRGESFRLA